MIFPLQKLKILKIFFRDLGQGVGRQVVSTKGNIFMCFHYLIFFGNLS